MLVHEKSRPLTAFEKSALSVHLEIPLTDDDKKLFDEYLRNSRLKWRTDRSDIIKGDPYLNFIFSNQIENNLSLKSEGGNEQLENILALLVSFSKYQYNL
ncbi:hypothetical protein, partial [Treponema sp. R6D11]